MRASSSNNNKLEFALEALHSKCPKIIATYLNQESDVGAL